MLGGFVMLVSPLSFIGRPVCPYISGRRVRKTKVQNAVFPLNIRILEGFMLLLASVSIRWLPVCPYLSGRRVRKPNVQTRYLPEMFGF